MNEDEKEGSKSGGLTQLGDIIDGLFSPDMLPSNEEKAKTDKPKKTLRPSAKLQAAAAEIMLRPNTTDAAYLARELVQCTLPHRDPGKTEAWARQNGNFTLVLQPGIDRHTLKPTGLPYGSIPRLLLLWIVTEVVRDKDRRIKENDRRIKLGKTLNEFLREIGLDPNTGGGKFSHAKRLKEQMKRLFSCRISFHYSEGNAKKGREAFLNMPVVREARFWWDFESPNQAELFESEIILDEGFFKAITASPVPVDMRAVAGLMRSPLAVDLYTWTTYRLFTMQRAGNSHITIPLTELKEQFGSEYTRIRDFKTAFVEALVKVQEVFPALDYSFDKTSLILRDSKQQLAIAPNDKTAAQKRLTELRPYDQVSEQTRAWFKREYPGWDAGTAIADFYAWRVRKEIVSADTDQHFKAYAKKWIELNS